MTKRDPLPSDASLSERLAELFGPEVEPHISLVPPTEAATEAVAELLRRGGTRQRYEEIGEIDRGGMGQVLEVYDRDLRRTLAMKVVLEDDAGQAPDGRRVARFLEEAQITAQLDHPGVVPVHELGLAPDGRVYFTMRRVRGRDLREVLHCVHFGLDGWSEARALTVLLRVCEAVAFAHSRGVIHRDLKPANIMVGAFGEVYVMDWGLARVLGREPASTTEPDDSVSTLLRDERSRSPASPLVTSRGDVLGTPAYMPPEQARGQLAELSPRADVYAIGAMLYHLLAQAPPYFPSGAPTTQVAALEALRQGPPLPLEEVRDGIAPELLAICGKAMAFDSAQRYPDVRALADDLRAFLEQRVVSAYRTGAWAESRQWMRRNRPLAGALAAAALALIVGLFATGTQYVRAEAGATLARDAAQRADEEAGRAQASERVAREETGKVLRLADAKRLEQLLLEADSLWPALPSQQGALGDWLERARALSERTDLHRERLTALRDEALPYDDDARQLDRAAHPSEAALVAVRADIAGLETSRPFLEGDALERLERQLASLEAQALELEETLGARATWRFRDVELQWQHDVLAALVIGLEHLVEPGVGALSDVAARLELASHLEGRSRSDPYPAALWAAALEAIADSDHYTNLVLEPQLGLLPLGPDPSSGLWEFAHLASGAPAVRGEDGRLALSEATGVVLVLIPSGRFTMGAQRTDPGGANFDPSATEEEGPPRLVELDAFFLSKFELTQAQWLRAANSNPSVYGPHQYSRGWNRAGLEASLLHPVEQVSWGDCARILPRIDLWMPTEAQWEYAARGGTSSAWWTGDELTSLQGAANLADRFGVENGAGGWPAYEAELDDGHTMHAPVGSLRANGFGIHDTAGNVFEWCGDGFGPYSAIPGPGDGARPSVVSGAHPRRGGAWSMTAYDARSACRNPGHGGFVSDALGVRPARALR